MKQIKATRAVQRRANRAGLIERTTRAITRYRERRAFINGANKFAKGVDMSVFDAPDFFEFLYEHHKSSNKSEQEALTRLREAHEKNEDPLADFAELRFETPQQLAILSKYFLFKADQISSSKRESSPRLNTSLGQIDANTYFERAAAVNRVRAKMLRYASMKKSGALDRMAVKN